MSSIERGGAAGRRGVVCGFLGTEDPHGAEEAGDGLVASGCGGFTSQRLGGRANRHGIVHAKKTLPAMRANASLGNSTRRDPCRSRPCPMPWEHGTARPPASLAFPCVISPWRRVRAALSTATSAGAGASPALCSRGRHSRRRHEVRCLVREPLIRSRAPATPIRDPTPQDHESAAPSLVPQRRTP
jgi:hypothetical protein